MGEEAFRVFKALSNRYRLEILRLVERGVSAPDELVEHLRLSRSGVERHLGELLDSGLLRKRVGIKNGRPRVSYALSPNAREILDHVEGIAELVSREESVRAREEGIRLLKKELKSVEKSLRELEDDYFRGRIDKIVFLQLRGEYLSKISEIQKEILDSYVESTVKEESKQD